MRPSSQPSDSIVSGSGVGFGMGPFEIRQGFLVTITDGTSTEIKKGLKAGDEVFVKRPVKTEKEKEQNQKG